MIDVDELNLCLEWDRQPTTLDVGLLRRDLMASHGANCNSNNFDIKSDLAKAKTCLDTK